VSSFFSFLLFLSLSFFLLEKRTYIAVERLLTAIPRFRSVQRQSISMLQQIDDDSIDPVWCYLQGSKSVFVREEEMVRSGMKMHGAAINQWEGKKSKGIQH
jgi:hypothetical protein